MRSTRRPRRRRCQPIAEGTIKIPVILAQESVAVPRAPRAGLVEETGLRAIGQGLADVGESLGRMEVAARRAQQMTEAADLLSQGALDLDEMVRKETENPDAASLDTRVEAEGRRLVAQQAGRSSDQDVQAAVHSRLTGQLTTRVIEVRTSRLKILNDRGQASTLGAVDRLERLMMNAPNEGVANGLRNELDGLLIGAGNAGFYTKADIEKMRQTSRERVNEGRFRLKVLADPLGALEDLESGRVQVDPVKQAELTVNALTQYRTLVTEARKKEEDWQKEFAGGLASDIRIEMQTKDMGDTINRERRVLGEQLHKELLSENRTRVESRGKITTDGVKNRRLTLDIAMGRVTDPRDIEAAAESLSESDLSQRFSQLHTMNERRAKAEIDPTEKLIGAGKQFIERRLQTTSLFDKFDALSTTLTADAVLEYEATMRREGPTTDPVSGALIPGRVTPEDLANDIALRYGKQLVDRQLIDAREYEGAQRFKTKEEIAQAYQRREISLHQSDLYMRYLDRLEQLRPKETLGPPTPKAKGSGEELKAKPKRRF